ncbi:MAG: DNA-binding response regulator [Candidatus Thermofonsia Clade 1 bacterium]|jgi:two-component system alkaline phosphatase synthesis response regulator PhoP|uniref:DNA-binding response regulator n=1 Tax=Candidatus Thermofonsia Clade 1 bacterium TaxID=2364210 RepID=A0A2M8PFD0_9CHLR|nr:MAG: DNA-binding response regulator [Candidatus Thermofonsia Clade 1 bacterium]RMF53772.1 MAG: DNA-binding response regulator [Chloroflexota bacterium]
MQRPTRVLIIEDQVKIVHWLSEFLKQAHFEVLTAYDGRTGLQLFEREKPDVILLDLMLPDMDGLDVCRIVRQNSDAFIIMITARVEETDRLLGLEIGADDYVTKPFSPREVVARIRALLRRASGALAHNSAPQQRTLSYGELALDPNKRLCTLKGEPVNLTPTEFDILHTLMKQPGVPFTRERLINEALGYDYVGYERTIDVHIRNLRRKIEPDIQNPQYIQTVFGVGYRFADALPTT